MPHSFALSGERYCRPGRVQPSQLFLIEANAQGEVKSMAESTTVRAQPLIAVRDVRASSRWYGKLLGTDSLPDHRHRDFYDRVQCAGEIILQLHAWDVEHHPNLTHADAAPPGHGVLIWFEVGNFDVVVGRARALHAEVILEPHVNPNPQHREIWLRDPDGYVLVIASPDGEVSL